MAVKPLGKHIIFVLFVCLCFGQSWHQDPKETGQARKMVQNRPKVSPADQVEGHVVANSWSKPKTKMQHGCSSDRQMVSRSGLLAKCVCWRPGAPRPNNHTFPRKDWFAGLAKPPKNHLAKKPLRDPFDGCLTDSEVRLGHTRGITMSAVA